MRKLYCLFLLLLLASIAALAQETSGSLTGMIKDPTGQPLGGASILATHVPSGTRYATTSASSGIYNLSNLRIGGPYRIEVSYAGLVSQTRDSITVTLGEPQTVDFSLEDKGQLTQVTVKAAAGAPKANSYGAGLNINRDQVRNMPTISRSIQDVTRLVPQGSKDNSFAGASFRYNNVTIDGAINNDAIGFSPSLGGITGSSGMPGSSARSNSISMDAIEDMQVYLAPYDVKIGNFTGGSINAVTRSGTNTVTGSVYAYGRNAALIGKDRIGGEGKMPSAFHDYQTGFRVGFPLIKDKLFFFTNEEIARRVDPIQQIAGSQASSAILGLADAQAIRNKTMADYGWDPGTYGQYNVYANSDKYFNRLDWNIDAHNQVVIRNNTIISRAINLERDQQDFRFGSIAYQQVNNQTSTVAEWKGRWTNQLSNSLVVGYTNVHDYRNPSSSPTLPQVQIQGIIPGTTIFMGTDREGAIFDQRQRTIEISDNLTWNLGRFKLLYGTHNELYHIDYNFVNSWNGRVDYLSIQDFLNSNPYRVRGSYNYTDDSRGYIWSHPSAQFNINLYSAYAEGEVQLNRLKLTTGLRFDYTDVPQKQILSSKTQNAYTDTYFGNTYTYTPLSQITGKYFSRVQVSPRLGFRYDWRGDQQIVLRGGVGLFTGRIPFAWLGYAFYNNGDTYGAFDQKADQKAFAPGSDPMRAGKNGIYDFIAQNSGAVNNKNVGKTQVDVVDNHFVMPKALRTSAAIDYTTHNHYKLTLEAIYTKVIRDVVFRQVNTVDNPTYYAYDVHHQQPIFPTGGVDPRFANAYELGNTGEGYRYSLTASLSRNFSSGVGFMAAYTFGHSKDISNGIRNSLESNWQLNQALNPNNPGLANSNFDVRHRIVLNANYRKAWNKVFISNFALFISAQSGSPFTYGFVNNSIQGTGQQVSLAYIPATEEAIHFFKDYTNAAGTVVTAASQATAFNQFIDANAYLRRHRGGFTERNGAFTPWNTQADFHFGQEIHLVRQHANQYITLTLDIMNLTNLLSKDWGHLYFVPNTYNSTASVGLTPLYPPGQTGGPYPAYTFTNPGNPYSIDYLNSRYQLQLGVRYTF